MSTKALPPGPYWMVDDESELVHATVGMLRRELGEAHVRGSTDPRELVTWIASERPTALITDVRMPYVGGLELVTQLHEHWGPVPVVVMTAYPTALVSEGERAGRFAYLPKPFSYQALRDTLLRITSQPAPAAFSGAIAVTMLAEIVQLYGLANRTGILEVLSPEGSGDIHFEGGRVVHARAPGLLGVAAFNKVLSWKGGSFAWKAAEPTEQSIFKNLSELLIDAYRISDEQAAGLDAGEDDLDLALMEGPSSPPVAVVPETPVASPDGEPGEPRGNVLENCDRLRELEGFVAVAAFDLVTSTCVASVDADDAANVAMLAAGNADLVRAKRATIGALNMDDQLEDIIITLQREYHLLRVCRRHPSVFLYLVLDRVEANLAMARYVLAATESNVVL